MQRLKIDCLKFTRARRFQAKDGSEYIAIPVEENNIFLGEKGAYLELSILDNRDGPDQYGNDGFAAVDVGKDRREAGEKGPIVGNWKYIGAKPSQASPPKASNQPVAAMNDELDDDDSSEIPF